MPGIAVTLTLVSAHALTIVNDPAAARVAAWLSDRTDVTMLPSVALAPDVRYQGDICGLVRGHSKYEACTSRWLADSCELFDGFSTEVVRCASVSSGGTGTQEVAVRWRATWNPATLLWLLTVAERVGWSIERYDLLERADQVSVFSWRATLRLLWDAVSTGSIRLPLSAVEGRALLQIEEKSGLCVSHRESIDLVALAELNRLKSRRVAQDLAEFLDVARRPDDADPDEWAGAVRERVLSNVPGAGPLDIEPLDTSNSFDAAAPAAFLTACALIIAVSTSVSSDILGVSGFDVCDQVTGASSSAWYDQCISDLFA